MNGGLAGAPLVKSAASSDACSRRSAACANRLAAVARRRLHAAVDDEAASAPFAAQGALEDRERAWVAGSGRAGGSEWVGVGLVGLGKAVERSGRVE